MENSVELRLCRFGPAGRSDGFALSWASLVAGGGRDTECEWDGLEVVGGAGLGGFDIMAVSASSP